MLAFRLLDFKLSAVMALSPLSLLLLSESTHATQNTYHSPESEDSLTLLSDAPLTKSLATSVAQGQLKPTADLSPLFSSMSEHVSLGSSMSESISPSTDLVQTPAAELSVPSVRLLSQADTSDAEPDPETAPLPELESSDEQDADTDSTAPLPELTPTEEAEPVTSPEDEAEPVLEESPMPNEGSEDETESDIPQPEVVDELPPDPATSIPIPEATVLDPLQFLDPDPNPLLIQTQPEEVELIGQQPITLQQALELSYRNNPDLRVVLLELEQSRQALREAQAARLPTVSVSGTLQGQNTTDTSSSFVPTAGGGLSLQVDSNEELGVSGSAQLDVNYNLYSSGGRRASIRAAEEQVRLNELEVERRQEELRINTANEYYDLQVAIESIRISRAFLDEAERNLRDTSLREEVGVGTRFDVLRAEVQVANARQDLVNAEASEQVAQRTLVRRLNLPPSLTITTVPVDIEGTWALDLEESIVLAYQNRAELEQQLVQRDISEQLRRSELSVLGPQVDLFANLQVSDILTQDDTFNDSYQFGAQVSWVLFEGGAARARARQQELEIEVAERNFEESRNTVRLGVESAYFTLQSNFTNIETARLAVEQAQEALDLAILRFDAGVGTQLDILNAQSELTDAEVNLVQAVVGYNRSLAELERAVSNLPESTYTDLPY
ncbi:MAG: TolC family protein [Cyanobacteria bacterium P01_H01_bin.58]